MKTIMVLIDFKINGDIVKEWGRNRWEINFDMERNESMFWNWVEMLMLMNGNGILNRPIIHFDT